MVTIELRVINGQVVASVPGDASAQGSVFVNKQASIRWRSEEKDLAGEFQLTFADVLGGNAPVPPFDGNEMVVPIAKGQTKDKKLKLTAPAYLKYTAAFKPTDSSIVVTPHDPMIIIRGGKSFTLVEAVSIGLAGAVVGAVVTYSLLSSGTGLGG